MSKVCIKCNELRDESEYKVSKRGVRNVCRDCYNRGRRTSDSHRRAWLREGLEIPKVCECCGKESNKIVCDHDHVTGNFRGWLCDPCNRSIGQLGDNLEGLINAVFYLSGK
jgi:hypothetical protein